MTLLRLFISIMLLACLIPAIRLIKFAIAQEDMLARTRVPHPRTTAVYPTRAAYDQATRRTHRREATIATTTWAAIATTLLLIIALSLAPWILP